MKQGVIFFDIGHTLVTGADQSPRRLLASRLGLSEKQAVEVGRLIMTDPSDEPRKLIEALKPRLSQLAPELIRDVVETTWTEQIECVREIEGATALACSLKAKGYELGLISNIWHPFYQGFCRTCRELSSLIDYTVLSYRVGIKKPSIDLYRKAVEKAGASPAACWMVGDTYELDMAPARQVGMKTIWVLRRPEKERPLLVELLRGEKHRPDWVVEDIGDILHFFAQLSAKERRAPC